MSQIILKFLLRTSAFYQVNLIYISFYQQLSRLFLPYFIHSFSTYLFFFLGFYWIFFSLRDEELQCSYHTAQQKHRASVGFPGPAESQGASREASSLCYTCSGLVPHLRSTNHGEPTSFLEGSKQVCSLSWRGATNSFLRVSYCIYNIETQPQERAVGSLYSWHDQQLCAGMLRVYGSLPSQYLTRHFLG